MKSKFSIKEIKSHFPTSLLTHKEAFEFIRENKLWQGLGQYGWFSKALLFMGLYLGWQAFDSMADAVDEVSHAQHTFQAISQSFSHLLSDGFDFFNSSFFKYVVFILMEVVVFHFARRTLEIKTKKNFDTTFDAFWAAEKRMIKVAIRCAIIEWALLVAISTTLSILGLSFFKPILALILQCYFLGFLMLDNFNEIFHLTIKESASLTRAYAGVALAIGFVSYLLMLIPVIGTFLAPLLGAVTATLSMHQLIPGGPVSEVETVTVAETPGNSTPID